MIQDAEKISREFFVDNPPAFCHRPNFRWKWRHSSYSKATFGSSVGPDHSIPIGGLHELAHMVDFSKRGILKSRVRYDDIIFARPYAFAGHVNGHWYNNEPETARGSLCEIRTFATQAMFMMKIFGHCWEIVSMYDVMERPEKESRHLIPLDENRTYMVPCTVEEYAEWQGTGIARLLDDSYAFINRYLPKVPYADQQDKQAEKFAELIMREYRAVTSPFGERRIGRALDSINTHMGKLRHGNG